MPRIGIDARKLEDGGIGRHVAELLRRVPHLAPEARFVALATPAGRERIHADATLAAPNLDVVTVHAGGYSLAEHVELARVARRQRLDLLHVPHYVVPLAATCPLVVTVHDLIHWRLPKSRLHLAYVEAALAVVRMRARVVLTPSHAVARDLATLARIDVARTRVVPNGVDADWWGRASSDAERTAFRERHGVGRDYVLNVTNGLAHKGLDLLLDAWREIDDLQLVLVGRGSDRAEVRRAVDAAGLRRDAVRILGALDEDELRLAYQGATAVVVASRLEGFGLPALEAMAAGVPVVAAEAGALPEVVADAGLLFPVDSVAYLRRALYRCSPGSDLEGRGEMIRRGLARAREFTWDRTAQETYAAYEQALRSQT